MDFGDWGCEEIWVVASGPSLTKEDCDQLEGKYVIAVNSSIQYLPFASAIYACDLGWWKNHKEWWEDFEGEKFTWSENAANVYKLTLATGRKGEGLGKKYLHAGGSSGYMAINLAYFLSSKLKRIYMLGFDMQYTDGKSHFHGDHKMTSNPTKDNLSRWAPKFNALHEDLKNEGIDLINCTRQTAITISWMPFEACLNSENPPSLSQAHIEPVQQSVQR